MGCSEKDLCIKCDKGGKLLLCSDSGCPLAVHEKCMGCPARFDDMGNFYCPYCLYRQAIARSRQARENAVSKKKDLSTFIDEETMDCDWQKQKSGMGKAKEQMQLRVTENVGDSTFYDIKDRLENSVSNNPIQLEEDKEEECASEPRSVSPCRAAGLSSDKQNDFTAMGERNSTEPKNSSCQFFGHETELASIIASGSDDVNSDEETAKHFEVVKLSRRVKKQLWEQVDDQKFQRGIEYHGENGPLCGSPVMEEKTSQGTRDELERLKEDGSRSTEEQHTPVQEQETVALLDEVNSMSEIHLEAKRGNSTSNKTYMDLQSVSRQSNRIKQNSERKVKSSNVDFSRSSPRVRKTPSQTKKTNASSKLRIVEESFSKSYRNTFPRARRKKLPWTENEEEMLREGVQKFAFTTNKNIPWRKVLEFGHHVFESSRTPEDLKDKWRNMFAKEDY